MTWSAKSQPEMHGYVFHSCAKKKSSFWTISIALNFDLSVKTVLSISGICHDNRLEQLAKTANISH